MTEPTDADRERADGLMWRSMAEESSDVIAVALAEERAKARTPFLALAAELDATADAAWREAWEAAAERIRRAAEETE